MKKSFLLEGVYLILIFSTLLLIGPGILLDHKIKHDFPYAYLASDAFQHQIRAEAIKDAGNFKYDAPYIAKGFDNVIGRYPPILYHLAAVFSYLSGLEVYDSIYFIVFFFSCFAVLILYLIIKDFNKSIAILSLPLPLLIFSRAPMTGFVWGHWPSLLGQFFLIALFWCFAKFDLDKAYIFIGIFLSAVILSHTANLVFALFFILLFFIMQLLCKNLDWQSIKKMLYSCIIALVLTLYYLIIFKSTWAIYQPYTFGVMPVWEGNPGFYIMDFKFILPFILIGIIFSILAFKNKPNAATLLSFSMLLFGFGNYAGFNFRAFQVRFLWPIYLSFFFGFAVYQIFKLLIRNCNLAHFTIIGLFFVFLFSGIVKVPFVLQYEKFSSQGLMDNFHWEALSWIAKNAQQDAKIYFFYGDIYSQDALLRNSKRFHYQVDPDDFAAAINERKIKKQYVSELPGDGGGGLAYRKSFLAFGDYQKETEQDYFFGKKDVCNFNYFVFDKFSRQKVLADYNFLIANEMLNKSAQIAFQNGLVVILKNNKVGGDCIEERIF